MGNVNAVATAKELQPDSQYTQHRPKVSFLPAEVKPIEMEALHLRVKILPRDRWRALCLLCSGLV